MNNLIKGLIAGAVATLVLSILIMIKMKMGLMPDLNVIKMLASKMGIMAAMATLVLHLIFGAVLGGTYQKLTR